MPHKPLASAAVGALLALAASPSSAAILAQDTVDVSGGLQDVSVSGPGDLPIGEALYLSVNTGQLLFATWTFDVTYTADWWEVSGPDSYSLNGNQYPMHGALSGNSTIDVGHNGSYYRLYSTINDNIAAITVENHNHPFNVCADVYAVPIGQDCAEGSFPPNLSLGDFQVETDRTFTWTLSDTINPVPEPGTWTLLFGGFGAIGSALRRRRAARGATG